MSIFGRKDNVITYTVNKAVNTQMYITVQNGEVVVNAPWYFSSNKIQELLKEKKNWILSKMQEYENINISNIQCIKILGKNYDIKVEYKNVKTPELNVEKGAKIRIDLPIKYKKIGNEQILKMVIDKMYEQIANDEIENIMEKTRIMLGIAPEEYKILKMDKELGKCIDRQTIIINPEIVKYKREIIEYIVLHEFCHLKYKTHGKKFYEILEKYIPQYKSLEKIIKEYKY